MDKGFVCLRISGTNINLQEVSDMLKTKPSMTHKKGDIHTNKRVSGQVIVHQEDCWIVKTETASNETIEKATKRFLDGLLPSAAYLKNLAGKYNATLWISAYPETEQINLHLSQNTIKRIFDLGITLDFSIMFLKQFYDGTY